MEPVCFEEDYSQAEDKLTVTIPVSNMSTKGLFPAGVDW